MPLPPIDFFVLGTARAGTSALLHHLLQQPALWVPPQKPRFWAVRHAPAWTGPGDASLLQNSSADEDGYAALWHDAPDGSLRGEVSDLYLYAPEAAEALNRHYPDARLVAVLRHPAERAHSAFGVMRRRGLEPLDRFEDALAAEESRIARGWSYAWHYRRMGEYGAQLERWAGALRDGRLLVLPFDAFADDPRGAILHVLEHIGAPEAPVHGADVRRNAAGEPRLPTLRRMLGPDALLRRAARRLLPVAWRRRIAGSDAAARLASAAVARAPLAPGTRARLVAHYRDDTERVEDLLGRALPHWYR